MLFECTTDAPRIHSHVLRMCRESLKGAPQMHFEHTMGAPGMPHACFTDAPRILVRCTMIALRLSTDVSRAPHRYVFTMDVPWIQYTCTAYSEAGSLSLDNLVYLFGCLFMNAVNFFFKMYLVLHLCFDSFHISQISSLGGPSFGLCSAWRYGDFWRFGDFKKNLSYI